MASLLYWSGKASDCKPHQIDGQCGLSTFLGALYGIILVLVVNAGMGLLTLVLTFWWDRHPVDEEQEAG